MTTTQQALDGARRLAARAAAVKAGVGRCPYPADGTAQELACRRAWVREYLRRRPGEASPVDYGDEVTALAEGPDSPDSGEPAGAAAATQGMIVSRGGGR